jgi:LEA14-like dessication related protein
MNNTAIKNILFILPLICFLGCKEPQAPVLKEIRNIKVGNVLNNELYVAGEAVIINPNSFKALLNDIELIVSIDGQQIAVIEEETEHLILPNEDSAIPLKGRIDLKAVEKIMNKQGLKILLGEELPIQFQGYARAKVKGVNMKIPIRFSDRINLRNIKL